MEAFISGELFIGFLLYPSNTCQNIRPLQFPRGSFILCQVNRRKNNASFRRHFLDFLAFSPLEKLSLPTGLTHQMVCWHIRDMRSESRTNLFGKHLANIWNCTSPHSTQIFFWHVFGSIWFLQLWEEKSLELIMSVSTCASGQGTKNFDRYHEFQVFIYSILNDIFSSTIVYDQDADRSRGLY